MGTVTRIYLNIRFMRKTFFRHIWFRESSLHFLLQHQFNTHLKKQTWVKCLIPPPPARRDKEQCSVSPSRRSELRLSPEAAHHLLPETATWFHLGTTEAFIPNQSPSLLLSSGRKVVHWTLQTDSKAPPSTLSLISRRFSRGSSGPRVSFYFWKASCGENKPTFIILPSAFCNLRCL